MGLQLRPRSSTTPTMEVEIGQGENQWAEVAKRLWLRDDPLQTARPEVIKNEIWDPLERFLWPTFSEDASNHHVLLLAAIVDVKQRAHLPVWDHFTDRPSAFAILFRRILSLNLDTTLSPSSRLLLLSFVISAFQALETGLVRKECAPLVSITIWCNLQSEQVRNKQLEKASSVKKAWRAATRRFEAASDENKARIRFEREWIFSMLVDFLSRLNGSNSSHVENVAYCERFLEFLIDLESQLPTRRYLNTLILDLNVVSLLQLSKLFNQQKNALFRDLTMLFRHFVDFSPDDFLGQNKQDRVRSSPHYEELTELQRVAIKAFPEKLKLMALANLGNLQQRTELESHFSNLHDTELVELCHHLGVRTAYPKQAEVTNGRQLMIESLVARYERQKSLDETVMNLSCLPTEASLYDPALLRNEVYDGSSPLAIPKLNLQYLSLSDFLWRAFLLHRSEAFFEIRRDLEGVVRRMRPRAGRERDAVNFDGFSRLALPISKPGIIDVAPARVGSNYAAYVRAEIAMDVSRLGDVIRTEWESLRVGDALFLLSVRAGRRHEHGIPPNNSREGEDWHIDHVRTAEVVQILDENGRALRNADAPQTNGYSSRARQRRLLINLDSRAYKHDSENPSKAKEDVYSLLNVVVRRRGRENNFKPVLTTMQDLIISQTDLPHWFQEVFLGYGDPSSASFMNLPEKIKSVDFRDTFLDWQHLVESFPGRALEPLGEEHGSFGPPYVLQSFDEQQAEMHLNPARKRRRDQTEDAQPSAGPIRVSTYTLPNTGPYPMDAFKLNSVRFTPSQISAIQSGTQPGLSIIVGPPGTGKTDVATQIINLLYHNYPSERVLLLAHSNQALNQLFEKIINLDMDPRHLLRLGHGEEDLDPTSTQGGSYSKAGRVESYLENRDHFLAEVDRLARSIGAEGAHGNSCETASYFHSVYVAPRWTKYWDHLHSDTSTNDSIIATFPFHFYFSNAPAQPLFPPQASKAELLSIASGCEHHINTIFHELELIRPFELLRRPADRANHLLATSARIVAMTSTYAAMNRSSIANLGFHYSSLIMEEAAQITEIESFIPCVLQKSNSRTGESALKRIVLVGDHLQNSPVIQNLAFDAFANLGQSLFLRLIRLGVPSITLDAQGRCRPSLAELFKWRYTAIANTPSLTDLPITHSSPEFLAANAGFAHDYQFIDVCNYHGHGEREPTPHFIQNLGEAEYAVALYMYMRLLGYPAHRISVLATYAGQRDLIRDVLVHRCKGNKLFGLPRAVSTVDKYQGEQNDYIILSLVRTRTVGYLRDPRRLTVALSRARLGLFILGRRDLWQSCPEFAPAMKILEQRPMVLEVVTGEMYPTERLLSEPIEDTRKVEIEGVEHLGEYVYEMTKAKVAALGGEAVVEGMPEQEEDGYAANGVDGEGEMAEADGEDDDPLHQHIGGHFV
ncbi:MAG: hypothetical protein Q9227_007784 [Pyrenula ochraceoflavens]